MNFKIIHFWVVFGFSLRLETEKLPVKNCCGIFILLKEIVSADLLLIKKWYKKKNDRFWFIIIFNIKYLLIIFLSYVHAVQFFSSGRWYYS